MCPVATRLSHGAAADRPLASPPHCCPVHAEGLLHRCFAETLSWEVEDPVHAGCEGTSQPRGEQAEEVATSQGTLHVPRFPQCARPRPERWYLTARVAFVEAACALIQTVRALGCHVPRARSR